MFHRNQLIALVGASLALSQVQEASAINIPNWAPRQLGGPVGSLVTDVASVVTSVLNLGNDASTVTNTATQTVTTAPSATSDGNPLGAVDTLVGAVPGGDAVNSIVGALPGASAVSE